MFHAFPGLVTKWHPPGGMGVRTDSHVFSGYRVPPHYDSMIGKIITYGQDSKQAIARMDIALSEMIVEGISTNIPLHRELLHDPVFIKGGMDIHYLEKKLAARSKKSTD
ncbi:acetyl-CoA carboxylase biotin carboxylase subunit [Oligella ureolytica]